MRAGSLDQAVERVQPLPGAPGRQIELSPAPCPGFASRPGPRPTSRPSTNAAMTVRSVPPVRRRGTLKNVYGHPDLGSGGIMAWRGRGGVAEISKAKHERQSTVHLRIFDLWVWSYGPSRNDELSQATLSKTPLPPPHCVRGTDMHPDAVEPKPKTAAPARWRYRTFCLGEKSPVGASANSDGDMIVRRRHRRRGPAGGRPLAQRAVRQHAEIAPRPV